MAKTLSVKLNADLHGAVENTDVRQSIIKTNHF